MHKLELYYFFYPKLVQLHVDYNILMSMQLQQGKFADIQGDQNIKISLKGTTLVYSVNHQHEILIVQP